MRGFSCLGLGLLLVLSGCAGDGTPSAATASVSTTAAPATVSAATGGLEGTITDDESKPIAGADVALTGVNKQTKTDDEGKFSFSDLEPAEYSLIAQKLGYESLARKVTVVAGEVATAQLTLVPIAIVTDRQESYEYSGFFGFGFVVVALRVPTWILCSNYDLVCDQDRHYFETNVTDAGGITTVVDALVWESTAPLTAKTLEIRIRADDKDSQIVGGRSPVLNRFDEIKVKKVVSHRAETPFTDVDPEEAVQVYYQQKFNIYSSIFWGAPPPEGYTPAPA